MRIIKNRTIHRWSNQYPQFQTGLQAWLNIVEIANWQTHNEMKQQFKHASVLKSGRVVFNIHGNSARLIVKIEFQHGQIYPIWFGTHAEYNAVDADTVRFTEPPV